MSAHASKRRRGGGGHEEHENDERWLLTYADMITLLLALFIVLFSISVVNKSKFESLQRSLKEAFSGKVLAGGTSIAEAGADPQTKSPSPETPFPPATPSIQTSQAAPSQPQTKAGGSEDEDFRKLKRQIDDAAKAVGLATSVETRITPQGLRIRLLTDKVVFDSGSATIKPAGADLLDDIAVILKRERLRPIQIDGHTDDVPISTTQFKDNWALSTARATSVVDLMIGDGVPPARLGAGGYAWYRPVGSNDTEAGRERNRRVEILVQRLRRPLPPTDGVTLP